VNRASQANARTISDKTYTYLKCDLRFARQNRRQRMQIVDLWDITVNIDYRLVLFISDLGQPSAIVTVYKCWPTRDLSLTRLIYDMYSQKYRYKTKPKACI
jgi:hypothetical protein